MFLNLSSNVLRIKPDYVQELLDLIQQFDADVLVATYYMTAFSVWLSDKPGKRLYLMQDFPG